MALSLLNGLVNDGGHDLEEFLFAKLEVAVLPALLEHVGDYAHHSAGRYLCFLQIQTRDWHLGKITALEVSQQVHAGEEDKNIIVNLTLGKEPAEADFAYS